MNVDSDSVVAGVDDWTTLAFDLEGDLLREHDDMPTMTVLSDDGSTIIADPPVTALDATDGSVIWESEISNANSGADPMDVSETGSRVAVSTFSSDLFVLEGGEPIWEGVNESGPNYVSLAADGSTLAAMEVDNDARNADLDGYRV